MLVVFFLKLEYLIQGSTKVFLKTIKKYQKYIGVRLFTPFCATSLLTHFVIDI